MKIFPVFIPNAGCSGGCLFCDQTLSSGVSRVPTPDDVARQLELHVPGAGIDQIAFYGGSFTALPEAVQDSYLQVTQPYVDSGQISGIRISTRPDRLTSAAIVRLRRYGVQTVELGCQSFSDAVLDASGRECRAAAHAGAVHLLRDAGVAIGIQLMPGLPGASAAEARESLRQALLLKPEFVRIYPTVVLAGTRLADEWQAGRYRPLSLEQAVELCADLSLDCYAAAIPVLRFGVQASPELDAGGVLAGPYHPAFGQLVASRLWLRGLLRLTEGLRAPVVQVHPADLSTALGQRRCNVTRLQRQSPGLTFEASSNITRGSIRLADRSVDMMAFAAGNR